MNGPTPVVSSEQVQRLEGDKESLVLQLAVLNDQVEAQSEAIQEMERGLADEAVKLTKTEAMLQEVNKFAIKVPQCLKAIGHFRLTVLSKGPNSCITTYI